MSNVYPFHTEEQMEEEASLWVAKLDRGLSPDEAVALRRWLAENSRHRQYLLEMADLWDRMENLSVLSELFDPPAHTRRSARRPAAVWAVAASVLLFVAVLGALMPTMSWNRAPSAEMPVMSAREPTLYETGIGAHSTVNLPDGTRLLLNTHTRVSVAYSADERLLELTRGELHVEVAHDPKRPLRVKAGENVVEAVGTAFNVYLVDEQSFDVIVTEGRVRVMGQPNFPKSGGDAPVQELEKGQKLSVRASQARAVEPVDESVIEDRLSWRDGNLVFRGETLREALDEVSRYTPLNFEIADERIADVRLAGLYKAGDIDGLLLSLKENFNIGYQRGDDGTVVLSLEDTVEHRKAKGG